MNFNDFIDRIKIPIVKNNIYSNYLEFNSGMYNGQFRSPWHMKIFLIRSIEKSYNKSHVEDKSFGDTMKELHDEVALYWEKYIWESIKRNRYRHYTPVGTQYRNIDKIYKKYDKIIENRNSALRNYLFLEGKSKYLIYTVRILNVIIKIYYDCDKQKLSTKRSKIKKEINNGSEE